MLFLLVTLFILMYSLSLGEVVSPPYFVWKSRGHRVIKTRIPLDQNTSVIYSHTNSAHKTLIPGNEDGIKLSDISNEKQEPADI